MTKLWDRSICIYSDLVAALGNDVEEVRCGLLIALFWRRGSSAAPSSVWGASEGVSTDLAVCDPLSHA